MPQQMPEMEDEDDVAMRDMYDDMEKASGQARTDELRGLYAPDVEAVPGAEDEEASTPAPPPTAGPPGMRGPGMEAAGAGAGTIALTPEELLSLLQVR